MLQPKKKDENKVITFTKKESTPAGDVIAPTSASISYTDKNTQARAGRIKSGFHNSQTEGLSVDASGHSTAKPFKRKVVVSPGGYTRIVGDDGTVIKEGSGHTKDIQQAIKESEKKVNLTNMQRERNARMNNVVGGSAKDITNKEVNALQEMGHATRVRMPKSVEKAMAGEDTRAELTEKNAKDKSKTLKVRYKRNV